MVAFVFLPFLGGCCGTMHNILSVFEHGLSS